MNVKHQWDWKWKQSKNILFSRNFRHFAAASMNVFTPVQVQGWALQLFFPICIQAIVSIAINNGGSGIFMHVSVICDIHAYIAYQWLNVRYVTLVLLQWSCVTFKSSIHTTIGTIWNLCLFKEMYTHICNLFYHSSTMTWPRWLISFPMGCKDPFILHS